MPTNLTVTMGGQTLASKGMRGRSCGSVMTTAPLHILAAASPRKSQAPRLAQIALCP